MMFPTVHARTLSDLLVREEIVDVIGRLARGTDRLDREVIASCYHLDSHDDHHWFRGTGAEFSDWVIDRMQRWDATMHFVGHPQFRCMTDKIAEVDTYCVAHHIAPSSKEAPKKDMILGLRYVDRFECRDSKWLIAKRVCTWDWTYTVPFDPRRDFEFEDGAIWGKRNSSDITYGMA